MKKKYGAVFLILTIALGFLITVTSGNEIGRDRLSEITVGDVVDLGEPLKERYVDNSVLSKLPNGDNIIAATITGNPAIFYVYNLDANVIIGQWSINGAVFAHGHATAPNGDIYITTHEYAKLCRFNVSDQTFEDLGALPQRDFVAYQPCFDDTGENVFMGTYDDAYLYGYNIASKTWREYGTIFTEQKYNKALAYHNGYVYCAGNGSEISAAKLVKVNVKTGVITELLSPKMGIFGDGNGNSLISKYQYMDKITDNNNGTIKNYIGAYASPKIGGYSGIFFDLENEVWLDTVITGYYGQQFTRELDNGKTYFVKDNEQKKPTLHSFNFRTNEIVNEAITIDKGSEFQAQPKGSGICELKDQTKFPGKSYITVFYSPGTPAIFNLQKKEITYLEDIPLSKAAVEVRDIGGGLEDYIGMGAYKGRQAVLYDINKANSQNPEEAFELQFPFHQPESIGAYKGKMYYNEYSGGSLYELDPIKPIETGKNPKYLTQLSKKIDGKTVYMDRIFDMDFGDDLIVMSGFPAIDSTKGGFGYYNLKTGETVFEHNIIPDQSVSSVLYKDKKIYASTHIWGGTNTYPIATEAKVFIYDTETRQIIKEVTPTVNTIAPAKPIHVGCMIEGDDGRLWAIVGGTLIGMNMETLATEKEIKITNFTLTENSKQYFPYCLEKLNNGLLVGTFKDGITIVDTYTEKFQKVAQAAFRFDIASDNNIYYTEGRNLKKIPITYNADTSAPTPISNFNMTNSDRSVNIKWTDPADTDLSTLYLSLQKDDGSYLLKNYPIDKGVQSYSFDNLIDNATYTAKIYSKDRLGNKSAVSNCNITINDVVPTDIVSNLKFFPLNGKIKYSFKEPQNSDYLKTKVTASNGYSIELPKGTQKGEITNLAVNTEYQITIESFDESNNKTEPIIRTIRTPSTEELLNSIYAEDNFEGYPLSVDPVNWETNIAVNGKAEIILDPFNANNKVFKLSNASGMTYSQKYLLRNVSTRQLVSFKLMSNGISSKVGFFSNDLYSSTRKVFEIGIVNNQFFHWNDSNSQTVNLENIAFSPSSWYNIELLYKIDTKSTDMYVNGQLAATIPFNKATFGSVVFASGGTNNEMYIDDFKIEKTTADVPPSNFSNIVGYATKEDINNSSMTQAQKDEFLKYIVSDNYNIPPNMTNDEWENIKPKKVTFKLDKEYNGSIFIILDVNFNMPI